MSQFIFGVSQIKPTRAQVRVMESVARMHGCSFCEHSNPDRSGYKRWFAGPSRGHPFDDALAAAVYADLRRAGL